MNLAAPCLTLGSKLSFYFENFTTSSSQLLLWEIAQQKVKSELKCWWFSAPSVQAVYEDEEKITIGALQGFLNMWFVQRLSWKNTLKSVEFNSR